MPNQFFAADAQTRDIYPELKKYFYKEHSNMIWEYFLTTKFGLWINAGLSTDKKLHGSERTVEKSGKLPRIKKIAESNDGDLTFNVFSLEDAMAHFAVSDPTRILTIEK